MIPRWARSPSPPTRSRSSADAIGNALRAAFRDEVWVRGEIRDLSRPQSGHVYFTLTDPDSGASLGVMLSSRTKGSVNTTLTDAGGGVRMTDGTDVRIRGRLDWYSPRGQLQLRMTAIDPAYTLGQLEVARAELLARLAAEGLLGANAGRALPLAPAPGRPGHERGLARPRPTSSTSSAGAGSPSGCSASTRGCRVRTHPGPSRRRSACCPPIRSTCSPSCEAAARAPTWPPSTTKPSPVPSRPAPVPVITGVGHEVDTSVADEVAHTVAKTPTACAQLLVARVARRSPTASTPPRPPSPAGACARSRPRPAPAHPGPGPVAERPGRPGSQRHPAARRSSTAPAAPRRRASTRRAAGSTGTAGG